MANSTNCHYNSAKLNKFLIARNQYESQVTILSQYRIMIATNGQHFVVAVAVKRNIILGETVSF